MADEADRRPSPDALLESAEREVRGRLRIFLGAAPGVGKTYEMLLAGRARKAEGVDVVIGVVETHGRKETEALVQGFEIIPRVAVPYKERALDEMDLDGILARRPQLVLVDELAHTNAPGSRHPKRYLDIEELLAAGIDVYTTVNIQHVESLNDIVAQITRIRVRETVPDSIIDRADDIEVIDLTPGDLIERLKQGKVYMPRTAKSAHRELFLARQSDGAARTRAAPHSAAGRRAACPPHAGARDLGPVGGRRPRTRLHRRGAAVAGAGPLWQTACRAFAGAVVGGHRRNDAVGPALRGRARSHRGFACGLPKAWAPRRRPCPAATSPRR